MFAFERLGTIDKAAQEKLLTLLFLKVYRAHLECCHQSYDLRTSPIGSDRNKDPLVFQFVELLKYQQGDVRLDFISSEIAFNHVAANKTLLNDPRVRQEHDAILTIRKNIDEGIYWPKD
ncbi:MAG: hypothetical protein KA175_14380 [Flavobacteriales bacterium]|nr:hypothetical protein [Flavobacteriales bacterium]MBP6698803.1 hypothetical protein [Flavobacteriales bacterium]